MRYSSLFALCLLVFLQTRAQIPTIKILESGKKVSIRGLSVVNDKIIWASGSNGSVGRSTDAGITWIWQNVPGYEKRDFRDIEAFDDKTAIIMGVAEPAIILKTKDGGKSWKKVFEDSTEGMFLDAMDFYGRFGFVIGDPIDKKAFLAYTNDFGDTWDTWPIGDDEKSVLTVADILLDKHGENNSLDIEIEGEAFFASSGTNLKIYQINNKLKLLFVSGGKGANLYQPFDNLVTYLAIDQGAESTGANSIDYFEATKSGIIVGGDFAKDTINHSNCVLFSLIDKEVKFSFPKSKPHGYRSCVIYLDEKNLLTCGTSGVDISVDGGKNWKLVTKDGFHVIQKAKNGKSVFLAGGNGRIAKLIY